MSSFLDRLIGRNRISSAEIAKERLKLVLVTDRSSLPQERLEAMQAEILEVIKRYMDIDEPQIAMKVEQRERENYLVADIPLHRSRTVYQAASELAPPPPRETPRAEQSRAEPPRTPAAHAEQSRAGSERLEISEGDITRPKAPRVEGSQAKGARRRKTGLSAQGEHDDPGGGS